MYDNSGNYLAQKVVTLNDTTTDTVTTFAKKNDGRQYDKLLSMETADEIAGVKKSARPKNGLETYTEAQYNGKNDTKEGLIRGESRQETRETFLRRAVQDVLQVTTRGKTAYGYRRSLPSDVKERSRQIEGELKRLGVLKPSVLRIWRVSWIAISICIRIRICRW